MGFRGSRVQIPPSRFNTVLINDVRRPGPPYVVLVLHTPQVRGRKSADHSALENSLFHNCPLDAETRRMSGVCRAPSMAVGRQAAASEASAVVRNVLKHNYFRSRRFFSRITPDALTEGSPRSRATWRPGLSAPQ